MCFIYDKRLCKHWNTKLNERKDMEQDGLLITTSPASTESTHYTCSTFHSKLTDRTKLSIHCTKLVAAGTHTHKIPTLLQS